MSIRPTSPADRQFMDAIRQVETGGLADPWIRTKMSGTGSSAYGPYQVTKGLIDGALKDESYGFDGEEKAILRKLSRQQKESLRIGGSDRSRYEDKLSREHLDRFDYGGSFDFTDAEKIILLRAQEKMLKKNLLDSGGDYDEAARRWHGGMAWDEKSDANPDPAAHVAYADKVRAVKGPQVSRDPRPAAPPPPPPPSPEATAVPEVATDDPRARMQAEAAAIMAEERQAPAPREYGNIVPEPVGEPALQGPEMQWAQPDSEPALRGPVIPYAEDAYISPEPEVKLPTDFDITLKKAPEWKMPNKRGMMLAEKNADQARTRAKLQADYRQMLEKPAAPAPLPIEKVASKGLSRMGPRRNRR